MKKTVQLLSRIGVRILSEVRNPLALCAFALLIPASADAWQANDSDIESHFLSDVYQLTFAGKRSGEGYFGEDGTKIIYQSEQDASNPFYQIYLFDLELGESTRVSPGHGKTTCAWLYPDGSKALYASTQNDPDALAKQRKELEFRESGQERRYSWDYDETYDIIEYDFKTKEYKSLTTERGYDAEGSYSPDGSLIAFASNRRGYSEKLTDEQQKAFEIDPAYMMDIYIMNADGSNVRQLTDVPGYDGGPFFSHDGKKICWRRFAENGATAEIFTMNIDGSDQKQLTHMNAMSWAPYFHPSGKYLIFNTNKLGFDNFELYIVDADGEQAPVRVSSTHGFDGLATWDRAGKRLTWTSNRTTDKSSQIFVGDWNHEAAMAALGLSDDESDEVDVSDAQSAANQSAQTTTVDYTPVDFRRHVEYLCDSGLEGRMTGSAGERKATAYVATYMDFLGLKPAGDQGGWFQSFEFPAGAELGQYNHLQFGETIYKQNEDWRPLTFSKSGSMRPTQVVFAGYGMVAPEEGDVAAYDSYGDIDVKDKWVVMFRYFPEDAGDEARQHFQYHSSLRKKAMDARDKGAAGIIIVSGPNSAAKEQLVPMERDFSISGTSVFAISVTDDVASKWFEAAGKDLKTVQTELDAGKDTQAFDLENVSLISHIEVEQKKGIGRNVIGRLQFGAEPSEQVIVVGAHVDHLGNGRSSNSLARGDEETLIHFGADDNASGVAAMLEIAEQMAQMKKDGKIDAKRDVIFAAWSGEELGLQGSQFFVESFEKTKGDEKPNLYPEIAAALNMDMVGRYDGKLILQGIGSSPEYWKKAAGKNSVTRLNLSLSDDTTLPTDASSFYKAGVPILSAFTGSHKDYHTPRDTPEKLKYEEASRIAKLMGLICMSLVRDDDPPAYQKHESASARTSSPGRAMRAYVGSIPDYGGEVKGVLMSGATEGSPAAEAGIQAGDIVVELAGRKIENINEYAIVIGSLKPGVETTIVVERGGERVELKLTPAAR
ncbi:MAG: M20/M25/M40 family metallo-hydrolase [Pirellulaceae bacterium]